MERINASALTARNCPMCSSSAFQNKAVVKNFQFLECRDCELIFSPDITHEFLSKLYSSGYHGPKDGAPEIGWSKNTSFLDPAFDLLPQKKHLKILDFGTGQDVVPELLREKGHRVIAVDIVPPVRPHPDRLTGDIISLGLPSNQFDLIFSFQVFEHLPNPRPILEELLRLTRPGGLILIHTDMETEERLNDHFSNWWYVAPPDHCIFYRHKTFENYLKNSSHELVWKDPKSVVVRKANS